LNDSDGVGDKGDSMIVISSSKHQTSSVINNYAIRLNKYT